LGGWDRKRGDLDEQAGAREGSTRGGGKNVPRISVVLDEQEQAELEVIVVDRDEAEALRFLKEVVWAQLQAIRRRGLHSHLEAGQS